MGKLSGKTVLIVGDCIDMNVATTELFVGEGARVYITGTQAAELDEMTKSIGENATGIHADYSNRADVKRMITQMQSEGKRLDILFVSADTWKPGHIESVAEEDFDQILNMNVKSVFFLVQESLSIFNNNGSIILQGSIASSKGYTCCSVYSAMKAMLGAFARCWSIDLKERNIRINVLNTDVIETKLMKNKTEVFEDSQTLLSIYDRSPKSGRIGHAQQLARTVLFLASEDSSCITGVELCAGGALVLE